MGNKYLYILRSCPGAGKSELAETISDSICCADDYFINEDGQYVFDADKLGRAHGYSEDKCRFYMIRGDEKIVVANTNTRLKDMKPYEELAAKYGYTVFHLIVENRHGGVDSHGVPEETKAIMRDRIKQNMKL